MDVESVSDALYGLPLGDFIAARTERERQARSAGDKDLVAQIHQLAKPNLVAWLANQLAREHADEIRPLLELGAALREATASLSGEQLRELSTQQRQVVSSLVRQARRLANVAGRNVSSDVERGLEDTLRAALADPVAADALAAGRLTEGMQNSGFASVSGRDERSARPAEKAAAPAIPARTGTQSTLERKRAERAERVLSQAKSATDKAATARQATKDKLETANEAAADAEKRVEQLRRELDDALQAQSKAEKDQRPAQAAFDRADQQAQDAHQRLAEAASGLLHH